ncbi:MAG TPA: LrgB family protein [Anaeromyxobacteraceae bacterium]|nr:LrgB family protein [Anaeromyxobacteraceae bacterium]
MTSRLTETWVYLSSSPLLWLTLTVGAFVAADWLYRRSGRHPLLNPLGTSVALLATVLAVSGTPYARYFEGAQFVHFLLGPAIVALAVPLHRELHRERGVAVPLTAALLAGAVTSVVTAVGAARLLGASRETLLSLAPKSVTAPVAMGIAEKLGGLPSLTAALVILTGLFGSVVGTALLGRLGVREGPAAGFALGVASHGLGTARAFELGPSAGAFAGLGMGLNALATSVVVPLLARLLVGS